MPAAPEFVLHRPRELGEVLSDTFRFLKLAAPTLAPTALRVVLPLSIVGAFLGDLAGQFEPDYAAPGFASTLWQDLGLFAAMTLASSAFFVLVSTYFTAFVFALLTLYDEKGGREGIEQSELRARAHRMFWPLVRVAVLFYLLIVGCGALAIIPCLGWVAAPVLIVVLAVRCALASAVVAMEGERAADALRRSYRLTEGMFWPTAGVLLIAYVLGVGLTYGFAFGPTFATTVALQLSGHAWSDAATQGILERVFFALVSCLSMVMVVVVATATGIHHAQLSERRDLTAFWKGVDARRSALGLSPTASPVS